MAVPNGVTRVASALGEDPWDHGDTLADWAEDDSARLISHLDLSHGRWWYWARRLVAEDDAHEEATDWGGL